MPPDCSQGGHLGQASLRDCVTTGSRRDAGRGGCPAHCPDVSWGQRRNDGECGTTTLQASTTCILAVNLWSHFLGVIFLQQLVSPKNGLRGRLVWEETFTDPLNQRVVHWSSMRPKLSIPWLNSWSCDANGEFLWLDDMNSWRNRWRSTRRGWWLLTR